MKQTRMSKRVKAPDAGEPARLTDDPRDADVVRAKALARAGAGSVATTFRTRAA